MEERERRIGLNETLFREVNERLEELAQGFAHTPQKLDLICECGNASCASRIEMDREEYEQVRSDSATFAIVKGHAIPDIEEIVERRKAYDVVRMKPKRSRRKRTRARDGGRIESWGQARRECRTPR